jgi:hypothetical protein
MPTTTMSVPHEQHHEVGADLSVVCEPNGHGRIPWATYIEPAHPHSVVEGHGNPHPTIGLLVRTDPPDIHPVSRVIRIPHATRLRRDGTEDDGTQRQHDSQDPDATHERPLERPP